MNRSTRNILSIAMPVGFAGLIDMVVLFVDSIILARYSTVSLAGASLATVVLMFVMILTFSMGVGTQVALSQRLGSDYTSAGRTVFSAFLLSVFMGITSFLIFCSTRSWILGLMVGGQRTSLESESMIREAEIYLGIVSWAILFGFSNELMRAVFSAYRKTVCIFVSSMLSGITKLLSSTILVFGWGGIPSMGIRGAAFATLSAIIVQFLVLFGFFYRYRKALQLYACRGSGVIRDWIYIFKMSISTLFDFGLWQTGVFLMNKFLVPSGAMAVSLFNIGFRIQSMFLFVTSGLGKAAVTMVGRSYGAGSGGRMRFWNDRIMRMGFVLPFFSLFPFLFFPGLILSVFNLGVEQVDPVIPHRIFFWVMGGLVFIRTWNIIIGASLRSMGNVRYFIYLQLFAFVLTASLSWLLIVNFKQGVLGAYGAMMADEGLRGLFHRWYFSRQVNRFCRDRFSTNIKSINSEQKLAI